MLYKFANHPLQLAQELYQDLKQVHGLKCRLTTGYGDQSVSIHLPIFLEFSSFMKDILKNMFLIDEEVVIMIPDACHDTVKNIVELIYSGVCECSTVVEEQDLKHIMEILASQNASRMSYSKQSLLSSITDFVPVDNNDSSAYMEEEVGIYSVVDQSSNVDQRESETEIIGECSDDDERVISFHAQQSPMKIYMKNSPVKIDLIASEQRQLCSRACVHGCADIYGNWTKDKIRNVTEMFVGKSIIDTKNNLLNHLRSQENLGNITVIASIRFLLLEFLGSVLFEDF